MKLKIIQTITTFTLTLGAFSAQPVVAKVSQDELLTRILEVAREWKKNHKFEAKAQASLDSHLSLISDAEQMMSHQEVDADLQSKIEKIRNEAFVRISQADERGLPYLVFEYILAYRKQLKKVDAENDKAAANRYHAIEDSIQRIGLKAIPFLAELNSMADRKKATTLANKTKELIGVIAKKGDLAVEQAKIQIEFNRKTSASDVMEETKASVAELPQLNEGISVDMKPRSLDAPLTERQN